MQDTFLCFPDMPRYRRAACQSATEAEKRTDLRGRVQKDPNGADGNNEPQNPAITAACLAVPPVPPAGSDDPDPVFHAEQEKGGRRREITDTG